MLVLAVRVSSELQQTLTAQNAIIGAKDAIRLSNTIRHHQIGD